MKNLLLPLLEFLDNWTKTFDSAARNQADVIYLEFSKCFDTVPHCKILYLNYADMVYLEWILSGWSFFLLERDMSVSESINAMSKSLSVRSGVPQGSVLGPLLYLC